MLLVTSTEEQSQMTAVIILSIVVCLLLIICLILVVIATITVYKYKKDKREVPSIQVDDADETTDNRLSVHIEDNPCRVVIKKSALSNLDKFNMAIMEVLIEIGKHEETNNNIQQRIQRLIHQLSAPVRPPPPTRVADFDNAIPAVCDSRRNEPNELLTTLLKSELPGTHVKFMELLELKTNSS